MPRITVGKWTAAGLLLGWLGAGHAAGQPDAPRPKLTRLYYGVSACENCHNLKEPVPDKKALLYRGTEMAQWFNHDKHKDATEILHRERGQLMAKNLGYDVTKDARCINCHGVFVRNEEEADPETYSLDQRVKSGVSCVACHGEFKEWVVEHAPVVGSKWKTYTREDKERFGLNDLWDPQKRAALCTECHVGNAANRRIVTHEMYAAGHPPLPGFEMATFCDAMPRHWETLAEKVRKRPQHKDFYQRVHHFDAADGEAEQVQLVVASAVVAFRASMALIAAEAADKSGATPWPEFAAFDCYACHHDLKADSWRQKRGYAGPPGRPQIRPWPTALLPLALGSADDQAGLAKRLKALEAVFNKTPFGNPEQVAEKATALADWSATVLLELHKTKFDPAAARAQLAGLVNRTQKEALDFDSARQVSWGLKALAGAFEPSAKRPDLKSALMALDAQLNLELPKGQQPIAGPFLDESLTKLGNYNPEDFQKTMRAVAAALQKEK